MATEVLAKLTHTALKSICQRWQIREFSVFGSVLRDDFGPKSDIDVLVSFDDAAPWSLWDLFQLRQELEHVFGCPVDLVEPEAIRNPYRRKNILGKRKVLYSTDEARPATEVTF